MTDENRRFSKKTYEPPQITVIDLRPEEAVLGHCKSPSTSGPVGGTCVTTGACHNQGS